jgi:hypothetical protein
MLKSISKKLIRIYFLLNIMQNTDETQNTSRSVPDIHRFRISELIQHLSDLKATYGDLPVEFWDQYEVTELSDLDTLTVIDKNMLYLGGMLHAARTIHGLDCKQVEAGNFVYDN